MFWPHFLRRSLFSGVALALLVPLSQAQVSPSLGKLVVVGDSLAAGFQNFSLYDSNSGSAPGINAAPPGGQTYGFAALIAKQADTTLNLPLISEPGIPPVLSLETSGGQIVQPPTVTRGTTAGARDPQTLTVQTRDLAVPGFTVADALIHSINPASLTSTSPTPSSLIDVMAYEVLAYPSVNNTTNAFGGCGVLALPTEILVSEVACAVQQHPNTIIVALGSNDALQTVLDGTAPTSPAVFQRSYELMIAALKSSGAKIVVSNVPDVTQAPILFTYAEFEATCGSAPTGATANDYVVPNISSPAATSFSICTDYSVRSAALIQQARTAVESYNAAIARMAQRSGAVYVDVNNVLSNIAKNGYLIMNRASEITLTTRYLGGIFSLDGVHPTNTGYAILANTYIAAMNKAMHLHIPAVNVAAVAATDPLVF
jgi:lysophospholipase L1-like esterase